MVSIIEILPSTQTISAKENGEIAQENYSASDMFQDLKKSKNNFRTGCFAFIRKIKSKSAKRLFISQEKFGKEERSFCLLSTINGLATLGRS